MEEAGTNVAGSFFKELISLGFDLDAAPLPPP
jgi:hypothetical protein